MSRPSAPGEPIAVRDPRDGRLLGEVPDQGAEEIAAALARARAAQPAWAAWPFAERARRLRRFGRRLRDDPGLVAQLIAESGKPVHEAIGIEVLYALEAIRFFTARRARRALADDLRRPFLFPYKRARVVRHPRGVVAVIGPWNWPLLNNFGDAVAPLAAGNAVVLKPSERTPLTSLHVARLWREEGMPGGVFQVVTGRAEAGRRLVAGADMVFFTGGLEAGREVARAAAARLVPAVLELGGKSAMIVLADADLPRAARAAVWSAFAHSGQVCMRTERVLVEQAVAERFAAMVVESTLRLRHGAGEAAAGHDVGAITAPRQIEVCERQIEQAVAGGARLLCGGRRVEGRGGHWLEPAVLAGCTPDMAVMREETFGPLLPIAAVADAEAALRLANDSPYGLAASVWSRDVARARALARRLEAGSVCVNDVLLSYLCLEAPFGGWKASGLGLRHGVEALLQFCRTETVLEDQPLLGWLAPHVSPRLGFPYDERVLALLRWLMRRLY